MLVPKVGGSCQPGEDELALATARWPGAGGDGDHGVDLVGGGGVTTEGMAQQHNQRRPA
jgi:hypothetical protein